MENGDAGYETKRDEIRQENAGLLDEFSAWLDEEDVGRKTIDAHLVNADLFVNQFLCNGELPATAAEGPHRVGAFLSDWLPRNAIWIDADTIRRHADSLRHFYAFMHRTGRIADAAYEALLKEIRAGLPQWVAVAENDEEPMADENDDPDAEWAAEGRARRSQSRGPRDPKQPPRGGVHRRRPDRSGLPPPE